MSLARMSASILTVYAVLILGTGCAPESKTDAREAEPSRRSGQTLRLVHPPWSSEIASAHLFQAVLQERLGYTVQLESVLVEEMWRRVAEGEADVLTGAWLPVTHRRYYERYADRLEDLGPNLTGARIGLVVPAVTPGRQTGDSGRTGRDLVTIRSIPELRETAGRFGGRIIGIESGAGVMQRTRETLEAYELERYYNVVESDEERMLDRLAKAVYQEEWIVFTGWRPHWMFELYNLRFLEDPKHVFGDEESIHTMSRLGLAEEMPEAHTVLERILYEPEDLERLMRWIHNEEKAPYDQALRWIETHEKLVDSWVAGIE